VKPAEQQVSAVAVQPAPVVPEEIPLSAPAESELPAPKGHLKKLLLAFAIFCGVVLAAIGVLSITGGPANMTPVAAGSAWGAVYSVAFSPDGRYIASGGGDNLAKIWDTTISRYVDMPGRHSDSVRSVAFSHDGKYLASASDDKTVKIWEVASGRELYTLTGHTDSVYSVAFSPDGNLLASAGSDKTIKFWSLKDGRQVTSLDAGAAVYSLAFNPDGMSLAYGCADQTIKIQKVDWGVYISYFPDPRVLKGHHSVVSSVAFSPDGKTLASGSYDDTVKFWDVASGHELNTWNGWRYTVDAVAFSPDGRFVAAGGIEREVRLWDVAAGREIRKLDNAASYLSAIWMDMNHVGPSIEAVAFSPDGRYLAAGVTNSRGVELWDLTK
jgi:WD40 repeat protein